MSSYCADASRITRAIFSSTVPNRLVTSPPTATPNLRRTFKERAERRNSLREQPDMPRAIRRTQPYDDEVDLECPCRTSRSLPMPGLILGWVALDRPLELSPTCDRMRFKPFGEAGRCGVRVSLSRSGRDRLPGCRSSLGGERRSDAERRHSILIGRRWPRRGLPVVPHCELRQAPAPLAPSSVTTVA